MGNLDQTIKWTLTFADLLCFGRRSMENGFYQWIVLTPINPRPTPCLVTLNKMNYAWCDCTVFKHYWS